MSAPLTWRLPTRLSVSGSDAWRATQRVDVVHRDRPARVSIEIVGVTPDGFDTLVEEHGHLLATARAPWTELSVVEAPVLRRAGRVRTGWFVDGDGDEYDVIVGYSSDALGATVVTISVPRGDADLAAEALQIADTISLHDVLGPPANHDGPVASASAVVDWGTASQAWTDPTSRAGDAVAVGWITFEEAMAASATRGAGAFPGVDPAFVSRLDPAQLSLALHIAQRALDARTTDDPRLATTIEVAAAHDLLVTHEQLDSSGNATVQWYAARPDHLAIITTDSERGRCAVAAGNPEDLVTFLTASSNASPDGSAPGTARRRVDRAALESVHASGAVLQRVRTVYRVDGLIVGGEVEWVAGTEGLQLVRAAGAPGEVDLVPVGREELAAEIATVLPGGVHAP